jgi:hypothetical protein
MFEVKNDLWKCFLARVSSSRFVATEHLGHCRVVFVILFLIISFENSFGQIVPNVKNCGIDAVGH